MPEGQTGSHRNDKPTEPSPAELVKTAFITGEKLKGTVLLLGKDPGEMEISIGVFSRMGLRIRHQKQFQPKSFMYRKAVKTIRHGYRVEGIKTRIKTDELKLPKVVITVPEV